MKTTLFLLLSTVTVYGYSKPQPEPKIPTSVQESFKKQYPDIKDVDWEKENGVFEAEFKIDHVDYAATYDASGNLIQTEVNINPTALPKTTLDYLAKNFPGKKIKEATKIMRANGEVLYEVEASGDLEFLFDASGEFIKQKVEKADPNDPD